MLSAAELAAIVQATGEAEAEVLRLEGLAAATGRIFDSIFPTEAQRVARAARATFTAILEVRNAAIEAGDHESAAQVISNARELARPGHIAEALERPALVAHPLDTLAELLRSLGKYAGLLGLLLALGLLAWIVAQVGSFVPRRRSR
jgi:hypothetical protein